VEYVDPQEGFSGYLAFAGQGDRLAAGGLRVRSGLVADTVVALAEAMSLKERLLGLAVDGAKAGIDYDPESPNKREALRRFVRFLRPYLLTRLSLGPDLGTTWTEIEEVAHEEGMMSVKMAIAPAQGLSELDFLQRMGVLSTPVNGFTLAQRRAGHALAHAALTAAVVAGCEVLRLRVALQGFGSVGRGVLLALAEAGVSICAVADEHACLFSDHGLDSRSLLSLPHGVAVSEGRSSGARLGPPEVVTELQADVLVLAACEDAITLDQASGLPVRVVAVGANLGLAPLVEQSLHSRGIVVVPDFVGGCGGSASMDALFGAPLCPTPEWVLDHVAARMRELVTATLSISTAESVTPRDAAMALCEACPDLSGRKPYGYWKPVTTQLAGGTPSAMAERK